MSRPFQFGSGVFVLALSAVGCGLFDLDDDSDTDTEAGTEDPASSDSATDTGSGSVSATSGTGGGAVVDTGSEANGADVESLPSEGRWVFAQRLSRVAQNDCTFVDDPVSLFEDAQLVRSDEAAFTWTSGERSLSCALADGTFECTQALIDSPEGFDKTLSAWLSVVGTFDSSTDLTGAQRGEIRCESSDPKQACPELGVDLPCVFSIPVVARWQGK